MSFSHIQEAVDDPSDFQSKSFQELDENLRCPICKEFFDTTLILTTCSHSFCALCIRRSLNTEQNCPKCRKDAFEQNLIHNYDLDHVVSTWRTSRPFLLKADNSINLPPPPPPQIIQPLSIPGLFIDDDDSNDFIPSTKHKVSSRTSSNRRSNRLSSQSITASKIEIEESDNSKYFEKIGQKENGFIQHESNHHIEEVISNDIQNNELTDLTLVECPICCQKMTYKILNEHMDHCANGNDPIPIPNSSSSSSSILFNEKSKMQIPQALKAQKPVYLGKKPSKVVYAMQSDKDMKKILKDLGLPDHGDKQQRVWRHREYITLYNANYDSDNPVSATVLAQRLAGIEKSQTNVKLKRKITDLDEHKEKYRSEFDLLIEKTKIQRTKKEKK